MASNCIDAKWTVNKLYRRQIDGDKFSADKLTSINIRFTLETFNSESVISVSSTERSYTSLLQAKKN